MKRKILKMYNNVWKAVFWCNRSYNNSIIMRIKKLYLKFNKLNLINILCNMILNVLWLLLRLVITKCYSKHVAYFWLLTDRLNGVSHPSQYYYTYIEISRFTGEVNFAMHSGNMQEGLFNIPKHETHTSVFKESFKRIMLFSFLTAKWLIK